MTKPDPSNWEMKAASLSVVPPTAQLSSSCSVGAGGLLSFRGQTAEEVKAAPTNHPWSSSGVFFLGILLQLKETNPSSSWLCTKWVPAGLQWRVSCRAVSCGKLDEREPPAAALPLPEREQGYAGQCYSASSCCELELEGGSSMEGL